MLRTTLATLASLALVLTAATAQAKITKTERSAIRTAVVNSAKAYMTQNGGLLKNRTYSIKLTERRVAGTGVGMLRGIEVNATVNTPQTAWPTFQIKRMPALGGSFLAQGSGSQFSLTAKPNGNWQGVMHLFGAGAQ